MAITSVEELNLRQQLVKECIAGKWSLRRLRRTVQEVRGKKSAGGVSLTRPESAEEALHQIIEKSQDWSKRYREVWFQVDDAVFSRALTKKSARELGEQLREAKEAVDELRRSATDAVKYLEEQLRRNQQPRTARRTRTR
jgi:hypothetical protein